MHSQFVHTQQLYSAEDVRSLDRYLIENVGIPGFTLMTRAGEAAFNALIKRWPLCNKIVVLCGGGNNAGDGYLIASLARQAKIDATIVALSDPQRLKGDALLAYQQAHAVGLAPQAFDPQSCFAGCDEHSVIVDALLGTGLNTKVSGQYAEAIQLCNAQSSKVLAVDIPSGLSADTGQVLGCAVRADITVSFIGMKLGLLTGKGKEHAGEIIFSDLDAAPESYQSVSAKACQLKLDDLLSYLEPRKRAAHKGKYGHTLLIGGNKGFGGAISLAAEACARMGAGLTSVATQEAHCSTLVSRCPEVMAKGVRHGNELEALLTKASAIVIGPGLGQDHWAAQMMEFALNSASPIVLDADALNILSDNTSLQERCHSNWVLTPHPGEAARLLKCETRDIESDRLAAISELAKRFNCSIILKGSGTLICHQGAMPLVCPYGNPGMASGGMGDVLSGLIGGLITQEWTQAFAVDLAVCLHAYAADQVAAIYGERGLLASDLIPAARALLNFGCTHASEHIKT